MPRTYSNSQIQRGVNPVLIEDGRIINVDMLHWTVDVVTRNSYRQLFDLQVASPYLHFAKGEGIYVMPEVGAKVKVCIPSDGSPFVLCFYTTFERTASSNQSSTQTSDSSTQEAPSEVTFKSGRPNLQQGDLIMRGRDGNHVWLHRGGVVEIGSPGLAKRLYIPITNMIRDFCENYELTSLGGHLSWTVLRSDTSPDGEAETYFTIAAKEHAQDAKASIFFRIGHNTDTQRLHLIIASNSIDPDTGSITGSPVFEVSIDNEGNVDASCKDLTLSILGDLNITVASDTTITTTGSSTEVVGTDKSITASGSISLQATTCRETVSGAKIISSPTIRLGSEGSSIPVVLATPALLAFLASHTHPVGTAITGPPTTPVLPASVQSTKAFSQ